MATEQKVPDLHHYFTDFPAKAPLLSIVQKPNTLSYLPHIQLHLDNVNVSIANALVRILVRWSRTVALNRDYVDHFIPTNCPKTESSEQLQVRLEQISWRIPGTLLVPYDPQVGLTADNCLKFVIRKTHSAVHSADVDPKRKPPGTHRDDQMIVTAADIQWEPLNEEQKQKVEKFYAENNNRYVQYLQQDMFSSWEKVFNEIKLHDQKYGTNHYETECKHIMQKHTQSNCHINEICRPNYEDTHLALLNPGESIDVTFYLTQANNETTSHYAGSPVSAYTVLKHITKVKLIRPIQDIEDVETVLSLCPKKVFAKDAQNALQVVNESACDFCMQCKMLPNAPERIEISDVQNSYDIVVQTRNGIPLGDVVNTAFEYAIETCQLYLSAITDLTAFGVGMNAPTMHFPYLEVIILTDNLHEEEEEVNSALPAIIHSARLIVQRAEYTFGTILTNFLSAYSSRIDGVKVLVAAMEEFSEFTDEISLKFELRVDNTEVNRHKSAKELIAKVLERTLLHVQFIFKTLYNQWQNTLTQIKLYKK